MAEETAAVEQPTSTTNNGETQPDFAAKHPLEYGWTLWFDAGSSGKTKANSWGNSLRSVYTFETVEDFWRWVIARRDPPPDASVRLCVWV